MSQHDMSIANQGFPAFRADLNDALPALASNNSGATEPSTMFAHQWWVDTSANPSVLKQRNADNDAWITIANIDQTGDKFILVNPEYTGTLTGGTGVVNIGSGQVYKDASGNVGIGTSSLVARLSVIAASANSTAATIGGIEYGGSKRGLTIKTYESAGGADCGVEFNAANGLAGYGAFKFVADTTTLATIDSSGNLKFNSGYGSVATAYGCRAWVNFNGTGAVAIRASGNVSSITDNGTGDYTVNFTTAMPDADYCVSTTCGDSVVNPSIFNASAVPVSTTTVRVETFTSTNTDIPNVFCAIFR